MSRTIAQSIVVLLVVLAAVTIVPSPSFAQPFNSNANAEIGHDTSPTLETMT
jgi:hypothetical protein